MPFVRIPFCERGGGERVRALPAREGGGTFAGRAPARIARPELRPVGCPHRPRPAAAPYSPSARRHHVSRAAGVSAPGRLWWRWRSRTPGSRIGTPLIEKGPVTRRRRGSCFRKTTRRPRKRPDSRMSTVPGVMLLRSLAQSPATLFARRRRLGVVRRRQLQNPTFFGLFFDFGVAFFPILRVETLGFCRRREPRGCAQSSELATRAAFCGAQAFLTLAAHLRIQNCAQRWPQARHPARCPLRRRPHHPYPPAGSSARPDARRCRTTLTSSASARSGKFPPAPSAAPTPPAAMPTSVATSGTRSTCRRRRTRAAAPAATSRGLRRLWRRSRPRRVPAGELSSPLLSSTAAPAAPPLDRRRRRRPRRPPPPRRPPSGPSRSRRRSRARRRRRRAPPAREFVGALLPRLAAVEPAPAARQARRRARAHRRAHHARRRGGAGGGRGEMRRRRRKRRARGGGLPERRTADARRGGRPGVARRRRRRRRRRRWRRSARASPGCGGAANASRLGSNRRAPCCSRRTAATRAR